MFYLNNIFIVINYLCIFFPLKLCLWTNPITGIQCSSSTTYNLSCLLIFMWLGMGEYDLKKKPKSPCGMCHQAFLFVMLMVQVKHSLNSVFELSCNQACIFIRGEKFSSKKFKLFIDFHFCVQRKPE